MVQLNLQDYIGKTINKWTILEDLGCIRGTGRRMVKCRCSCGLETTVNWQTLKRGTSKSCKHCAHITTGYKKERLYPIWREMRNRCYNENTPNYKYYGGRGISVCEEWRVSYLAFREWAYANGYDENASFGKCTLDRIDVNGNYCPENCRWVDITTQNRNKSMQRNNKSGYTGVYLTPYPYHPWQSTVCVNSKLIYIGYYATKKEAVEARNKYIIDNNLTEYKIQEWKDE